MIVVSDTSAITSLIQIGREEVLKLLFDRVLIPPAVRDELVVFHHSLPGFLEVSTLEDEASVALLPGELDRGEAEAIILAEQISPDFLLVDDMAARVVATRKGLKIIGLLGVLILAKRSGFIASVADAIEQLETKAEFRISPELKTRILKSAEEVGR